MDQPLLPPLSYDELPDPTRIGFGDLVAINLTTTTNPYTHGLHRYPAKFIPQIPRWAIRQFSRPGDLVVDPFAGSGTSIVEAVAEGRRGLGVDLDRLACLISYAKVANLNADRLADLAGVVLDQSLGQSGPLRVPMAGVHRFEHWFNPEAWAALQSIKSAIDEAHMYPAERSFFLVAFSSILRAVSNADDQTQKTYVSGTLRKTPPDVFPTFERRLWRAIEAVRQLSHVRKEKSAAYILCASATDLPLRDEEADLLVTSPPYLDSVDYMYNLMLEYFWLGERLGINSRSEFNAARKATIGSKQPFTTGSGIPGPLRDLIDTNQIPAYRQATLAPYFTGMAKHFEQAARVLKSGGRYVLVIGNSRTQAGMLPVHDAMVILAGAAGLEMEHAFGYRVRRHYMKFPRMGRGGIILMDWVITLRKVKKRSSVVRRRLPLIDDQLPPDAVAN